MKSGKMSDKLVRQCIINANCIEAEALAVAELDKENPTLSNPKKLRSCKAGYIETSRFIVLYSYKTLVAIWDKQNQKGYDVLRLNYGYTATSAQHIAKFFSDIAFFTGAKWRSCLNIERYY